MAKNNRGSGMSQSQSGGAAEPASPMAGVTTESPWERELPVIIRSTGYAESGPSRR